MNAVDKKLVVNKDGDLEYIDLSDFLNGVLREDPYAIDSNAITQPTYKEWQPPKCECGSWTVYGEKCDSQMHADYCPIRKFHYGGRRD